MDNVSSLIKKSFIIIFSTLISIFILNFLLFVFTTFNYSSDEMSPYSVADKIAKEFSANSYQFSSETENYLIENNIWAIFINENNQELEAKTNNSPPDIPKRFSLSDISELTLGYISEHPTYVGETERGIIVLGFPKKEYWKLTTPTWDYSFISSIPQNAFLMLSVNIILIIIIYFSLTKKLINSIKPIVEAIKELSNNHKVELSENSLLTDIERQINRTSQILESQKYLIQKKDNARKQWITGVSHDIRTPLSIILIKAEKIKLFSNLSGSQKEYCKDILKQGSIIRNLINDLNLATQLEHNFNNFQFYRINLGKLTRRVTADILNDSSYSETNIVLDNSISTLTYWINGNERLLYRAMMNIIYNSLKHNPHGCTIYIKAFLDNDSCSLLFEDNGIGISNEQLKKIKLTQHNIDVTENRDSIGHGLGLKIINSIMELHKGKVNIGRSNLYKGFKTELKFYKK
ncbi:HAMP domain-containing histidine kinase [Ruoffia tabacinasalis]|uniref:histidine kinase n=1 Tax=Ruoffia tabacinasalis TaxID=87458 RepID=A0A5R9DWT8_9LACT|nr:HAMP domain-containing sensor histidine kinase [Ruoffia tabacinasalis]TLQ41757.1 HAMP domain-containing histidine kinase [Ruoffia tabacinasalis]